MSHQENPYASPQHDAGPSFWMRLPYALGRGWRAYREGVRKDGLSVLDQILAFLNLGALLYMFLIFCLAVGYGLYFMFISP